MELTQLYCTSTQTQDNKIDGKQTQYRQWRQPHHFRADACLVAKNLIEQSRTVIEQSQLFARENTSSYIILSLLPQKNSRKYGLKVSRTTNFSEEGRGEGHAFIPPRNMLDCFPYFQYFHDPSCPPHSLACSINYVIIHTLFHLSLQ